MRIFEHFGMPTSELDEVLECWQSLRQFAEYLQRSLTLGGVSFRLIWIEGAQLSLIDNFHIFKNPAEFSFAIPV